MKPDDKWQGYFAMPNERNKERLNYFLDKASDQVWKEHFVQQYVIFIKEVITLIPEELLCNAYYDEDGYSEFISWADSGQNDGFGTFSLSRYSETNSEKDKVDNFLRFNKSERKSPKLFMTRIIYTINLDDSKEELTKFVKYVIENLKEFYGRESQLG